MNKKIVIALGGNAITLPDVEDTITNQFAHTREALRGVVELIRQGYEMVITHGNGPQVGNALLRVEAASKQAPILPLGICVADTEGGMGYMIEQSLRNVLHDSAIEREIVTIVTHMIVDRSDPARENPKKFIGQAYSEEKARELERKRGWVMKQKKDGLWRRVVASPEPIEAVQSKSIGELVGRGAIVIAGGGGGIPVYYDERGWLEGVDAVIDKDLASAVIGNDIGAGTLVILTNVDQVALGFKTDSERPLDEMTVAQAEEYLEAGEFPAGSMGPKIKAAIKFINGGGKCVVITSISLAAEAIAGKSGTRIIP